MGSPLQTLVVAGRTSLLPSPPHGGRETFPEPPWALSIKVPRDSARHQLGVSPVSPPTSWQRHSSLHDIRLWSYDPIPHPNPELNILIRKSETRNYPPYLPNPTLSHIPT